MANQINLDLLWASTGSITDPGDGEYLTGWEAEIPTFQNFNHVLNALDSNILCLAEKGTYDWQTGISYEVGAKVTEAGSRHVCIQAHTGQQPSLDTTNSYWTLGRSIGGIPAVPYSNKYGLYVGAVNSRSTGVIWDSQDVTIENTTALIGLNTTAGAVDNLVLGNIQGELAVVEVGTTVLPDNRNIQLDQAGVRRLFHEGHAPTQTEVAGTIPEAPLNGLLHSRKDGNWVKSSTTDVQDEPPPPSVGSGDGWYNLADGQFYLDIDDGDSSQWVPANSPIIPEVFPATVITNSNVNGLGTDVQAALDSLAATVLSLQSQIDLLNP